VDIELSAHDAFLSIQFNILLEKAHKRRDPKT